MCVGLVLAIAGALAFSASASAFTGSATFLPTGGVEQEFVVAWGVTQIEVSAVGAAGHVGHSCNSVYEPAGGAGAKASAQLTVKQGQKLYVDFSGGGAGGNETTGCGKLGGAGGGASDVREEPGGNALKSLQSRLLVAGGGGGGGGGLGKVGASIHFSYGGAGGSSGSSAQAGKSGETTEVGVGTPGGGGEGGGSVSPANGGSAGSNAGAAGSNGVLGDGGAGAAHPEGCECGIAGPAGGGGGGYYGGGGGGSAYPTGGGGGAGSSHIAAGATNTKIEADAIDPQEVVISYTGVTPAAPTAEIKSPVTGGTYAVGEVVAKSFSCAEGTGGPGIESCKDSNGASETSGTLDTATAGPHTYAVTATSEDGQTGEASIAYTVVVPPAVVPPPAATPLPVAAATTVVAPVQGTPVAPPACVSERKLTIHVARHMNLPPGTTILSARVLLAGRLVATPLGSDPVVQVSHAGFGRGAFEVTMEVRTSTGKPRTMSLVLHTCLSG